MTIKALDEFGMSDDRTITIKAYLYDRESNLIRQIERDEIRKEADEFYHTLHELARLLPHRREIVEYMDKLTAYPTRLRDLLDRRDELTEIQGQIRHMIMMERLDKEQRDE